MSTEINEYNLGTLVKVYTETPFKDVATGDPMDPDEVHLTVQTPAGVATTYTYGEDDEVIRASIGSYYAELDADESGDWYYRWWSTGDGQAADSHHFTVKEEFVP